MSDETQRFSATSGRVFGVIGVAVAGATALAALLDTRGEPSYATAALAVFFGALVWAAMLRPRVDLDASSIVMRNMFETVTLPLVAVESVAVRQVLVVFAGGKRYTSSAIGRSRRQLFRDGRQGGGGSSTQGIGLVPAMPAAPEKPATAATSYGLFVEERLRSRVSDSLARSGIKPRSEEQARLAEGIVRRPAIVEISVLTISLLLFVVFALA